MSSKLKASLVVTTINDGSFLSTYTNALVKEGLQDSVLLIVIPDLKTPNDIFSKTKELQKNGFHVECPTIDEQNQYLKKLGKIRDIIPYNSDNRRNIGYIRSYELGLPFMISVDDDNYPIKNISFFGDHIDKISFISKTTISSKNGWFNNCELLKLKYRNLIYPRGFPYFARNQSTVYVTKNESKEIYINAGMWLNHPDMDAINCLATPFKSIGLRKNVVLSNDTWCPINTQNTALRREVIPSYYFIPMNYKTSGLEIDRYGDIFSGYFSLKCCHALGKGVRFGTPTADHIRNSHNYLKDLTKELGCIWVLEDFLPWLVEVKLSGNNFNEVYLDLSEKIDTQLPKFKGFIWQKDTQRYFRHLTKCMRIWSKTMKSVN